MIASVPRIALAVVVVPAVLMACGEAPDATSSMEMLEPALEVKALAVDRPETLEDTLGMAGADDLTWTGRGYVVVDGGNDRLVFFDRRLQPTGTVGRAGAGPGELELPLDLARHPDGIAVAEVGTGRVSVFSDDGEFLDVRPVPVTMNGFAVLPDRSILVATATPTTYLTRVDADGRPHPFAAPPPDGAAAEPGAPTHELVAVSGDRVLVLENEAGRLLAYDAEGRLLATALLPPSIREDARAYWEAFSRGMGIKVRSPVVARRMTLQPDGRVLILLQRVGWGGVLVDPVTLEGRQVVPSADPEVADRMDGAGAALLEGDTLTVIHTGGISRFITGPVES